MKHMDGEEARIAAILRTSRTIGVIGASPKPERHSHDVVAYLHRVGYDVIPVRPDRAQVAGLPTYARLDDAGGPVDLVIIFRRPDAVVGHIREAAKKHADAVWLPPGAWSHEAGDEARRLRLALVKDRCIIKAHEHLFTPTGELGAGHPNTPGVHVRRRHRKPESLPNPGYVAGGGGGSKAGGGVRAVLDEKKMTRRRG
jgi:predicted CoA-binding protein